AVSEMALTSGIGVHLRDVPTQGRVDVTWLGESAGRILVAIDPASAMQFSRLAEEWEVAHIQIGTTGGEDLTFPDGSSVSLADLNTASHSALAIGLEAEMA